MKAVPIKKQQSNIAKLIGSFFRRFHLLLFFIFIVGCLSASVMLINQTITDTTSDTSYTSSIRPGSIDEVALNKIKSLHKSDQPQPAQQASGRSNPFGE